MHIVCKDVPFSDTLKKATTVLCLDLQDKLANCLADCAVEYEGKLEKFKIDVAAQLSKATTSWRSRG